MLKSIFFVAPRFCHDGARLFAAIMMNWPGNSGDDPPGHLRHSLGDCGTERTVPYAARGTSRAWISNILRPLKVDIVPGGNGAKPARAHFGRASTVPRGNSFKEVFHHKRTDSQRDPHRSWTWLPKLFLDGQRLAHRARPGHALNARSWVHSGH